MRRAALLAIGLGLAMLTVPALAESVSITELDADPGRFDGTTVTITGEVIGDYGHASDVVWIQLNDDAYALSPLAETGALQGTNTGLGVRLVPSLYSDDWGKPGRSGMRGPLLEITGTFKYNSDDDQGETFIDAESIVLIEPARPISATVHQRLWPAVSGSLLLLAGSGLFVVGRVKRSRH